MSTATEQFATVAFTYNQILVLAMMMCIAAFIIAAICVKDHNSKLYLAGAGLVFVLAQFIASVI